MKKLLLNFILILISFPAALKAETANCSKLITDSNKTIKLLRQQFKDKKDVDEELKKYFELNERLKKCPVSSQKKVRALDDNEIAKYRASIYAPDRSANLPEEYCSETKVSTENMPANSNQNNLSWCFAWGAADLISFHEGTKVSAYDIALQYHNDEEIRNLPHNLNSSKPATDRGGNVLAAIQVASSPKGICTENSTAFYADKWDSNSEIFKLLIESPVSLQEDICSLDLYEYGPLKNLDPDLIKILEKLPGDKKIAALLDIACSERHVIKNNYRLLNLWIDRPGVTREKMLNRLDQILNRNEPVNVGYDHQLLYRGQNYIGKGTDHASTIIGRKFNKASGQCEYLLRNSWGTDDDCQKTSSVRCEKGNYWVSRTALKNNMSEVVWMEKKAPAKPSAETQK